MERVVLSNREQAFCLSTSISPTVFACFSTLCRHGLPPEDWVRQAQMVAAFCDQHPHLAHTTQLGSLEPAEMTGSIAPTPVDVIDPGSCPICQMHFGKKSLDRHVKEHYMIFVCSYQDCRFKSTRKERLSKHHTDTHPGFSYEGLAESSLQRLPDFVDLGSSRYQFATIKDMHKREYKVQDMIRHGETWEKFERDCLEAETQREPSTRPEIYGSRVRDQSKLASRMNIQPQHILDEVPRTGLTIPYLNNAGLESPPSNKSRGLLQQNPQPNSYTNTNIDSGLPSSQSFDDAAELVDANVYTFYDAAATEDSATTAIDWTSPTQANTLDSIPIDLPNETQANLPYPTDLPFRTNTPSYCPVQPSEGYEPVQPTADCFNSFHTEEPYSRSVEALGQHNKQPSSRHESKHYSNDTTADVEHENFQLGMSEGSPHWENFMALMPPGDTVPSTLNANNQPWVTGTDSHRPLVNLPPPTAYPPTPPSHSPMNHGNNSVHSGILSESPAPSFANLSRHSRASSRVVNNSEQPSPPEKELRGSKRKRVSFQLSRSRQNTWSKLREWFS